MPPPEGAPPAEGVPAAGGVPSAEGVPLPGGVPSPGGVPWPGGVPSPGGVRSIGGVPLPPTSVGLLERAINYALGSLVLVTPRAMDNPTPCAEWNLRRLLRHLDDSFLVLQEAVEGGRVELVPPAPAGLAADARGDPPAPAGWAAEAHGDPPTGSPADPVTFLRSRASRVLGAWASAELPEVVSIGGWLLPTGVVTMVGAVEVAVHGWDVARACGHDRPIPVGLASELLRVAPLVVADADRPARFAAPVPLPPIASPGDRLLAFLGRQPSWTARLTTVISGA